jgi:hypothetical protein
MYSVRYGNLRTIAAKTDGKCHLCHEPTDLTLYGPTGMFGRETATVDHLLPRRYGGDDHPDNLLIAHGTCNSRRGTREVDEVRFELAGTPHAPMSSAEKTALSVRGGALIALGAGLLLARPVEGGRSEFNAEAALAAGVVGGLLLRCLC